MHQASKILDLSTELKFINTREVKFSLDQVFAMYSKPEYLKEWFGPKGFTNTFQQFDFEENGKWNFIMHGPDGVDYQNECVFLKIIENELIIWNHLGLPHFQVYEKFTKISESATKIEFIMLFYDKQTFEGVMKFAPEKNEENFDKLEKLMKKIYGEESTISYKK